MRFVRFISLQEIIDITMNLILNYIANLNITKKEFKNFYPFATSQTYFPFKGKCLNQIDGVVIGSPLDPVIANIFMGFYKSKWLNEYNLNKTNFVFKITFQLLLKRNNIL